MKMIKKAAITAVVFSAALNFSACAYGPPEDELEYEKETNSTVSSDTIVLQNEAESSTPPKGDAE